MNLIRKQANKVFNLEEIPEPKTNGKNYSYIGQEKELKQREQEIETKLEDITKAEQLIIEIQTQLQKETERIKQQSQKIQFAEAWKQLNTLSLNDLNQNQIKEIIQNQEGFIKDLLEHYLLASEKEINYESNIECLNNKLTQAQKREKELLQTIDDTMETIGKIEDTEENEE